MGSRSETATLSSNNRDVEKSAPVPEKEIEVEEESDPYLVQLEPEDDPKGLALWRKWLAVLTISLSSLCATFASSVVRSLNFTSSIIGRLTFPSLGFSVP